MYTAYIITYFYFLRGKAGLVKYINLFIHSIIVCSVSWSGKFVRLAAVSSSVCGVRARAAGRDIYGGGRRRGQCAAARTAMTTPAPYLLALLLLLPGEYDPAQ